MSVPKLPLGEVPKDVVRIHFFDYTEEYTGISLTMDVDEIEDVGNFNASSVIDMSAILSVILAVRIAKKYNEQLEKGEAEGAARFDVAWTHAAEITEFMDGLCVALVEWRGILTAFEDIEQEHIDEAFELAFLHLFDELPDDVHDRYVGNDSDEPEGVIVDNRGYPYRRNFADGDFEVDEDEDFFASDEARISEEDAESIKQVIEETNELSSTRRASPV